MLKKLRLKYAEEILNKEVQEFVRQVRFCNFDTVKRVGIVYLYSDKLSQGMNDLLVFLNTRQIKVHTMSYSPASSIPSDFLLSIHKFIFCKRRVNWRYRPKDKEVHQFINMPFDMLIDFTRCREFPIHYVVSLSRAAMKIGRNSYDGNPYDFVMSIPEKENDTFYMKQLKHYLDSIVIKD